MMPNGHREKPEVDPAEAALRMAILDVLRAAQTKCPGLTGTWPKAAIGQRPGTDVTITLYANADPVINIYGDDPNSPNYAAEALAPPRRIIDRIVAIEAVVAQIVDEAQKKVDAYDAAHAKIAALRAKVVPARTEAVRTAEMARKDPQPRDRWQSTGGDIYRVIAVEDEEYLIDWEEDGTGLAGDLTYYGPASLGEEGETYLGVSTTLFGAP